MEKAERKKLGRRILSFVLTATLMVGLVPGNVLTASAEESSAAAPSVTAFATPEQLMSSDNFALHTDYTGVAQKVYFGMNGESQQIWYIAGGEDHDGDGTKDSIVLLCDPSLPMATGTKFEDDWENNKTYSADWRCTYETAPNEVYPNHYGASDLRGVLQGYTSNDNTEKFSAAEKELMQSTKVYTDDDKLQDECKTDYTYYTEDVLYPAYGDSNDDKNITVGANRADSLNGGLKVSLTSAPYNSGYIFWLRAPYCDYSYKACVASPGRYVDNNLVNLTRSVVPAFRLNLSSVLFASAATAATSGASLTDTMTFRVDGDGKITSQAYYSTDNVIVDAAEDETVYLYVQGKDGTTDWVYSQEVSADTTIATDTIKSGAKDSNGSAVSLTSVDLSRCEIWIEKKVTDDNLVYAVMAKEIETIATVAVTDITAPVAGAELDVAATCNTTGVSTTTPTVSYTKNGESVSGNVAGYLAGYTATVELGAAVGYAFTNETTATVNGNEASVSYDADTGKLTVSYTFDKTAKLPLGNAYYVTKDELMSSFDLDGSEDAVGKVYFGTTGTGDGAVSQSWYIAGSDAADSIVLLCDPMLPLATGKVFEDSTANKTYDDNWGCTYDSAPSEVWANHYGASDFRLTTLKGLENGAFTETEQSMMLETTVYTNDRTDSNYSNYSTTDTLYAAYGEYNGRYITVGANSAESLNGGLKVSLSSPPYNKHNLPFWLRTRYYGHYGSAQAVSGASTTARNVNEAYAVVPAFRINLSSVLFASAATAATSGASIETDVYGFYVFSFRMDGTEKLVSEAVYTEDGVMVNYDAADSTDGGQVYLYVQDADSVYSVAITEDTTVARASMTGIDSLTDESTKIWLEKSEDNLTYAVMAEYHENHVDAGSDGYCDVCGTKKDGISATLAGYSVSLGGQVGMNFYMDLAASVLDDKSAHMLFTFPEREETVKVYVKDVKTSPVTINGKKYYVFTCKVAAREMADTIKAQLVCSDGNGGNVGGTVYTYSVQQYADALIKKTGATEKEIALAKAMLNYGAYAQQYFKYNTNSPANAGYEDTALVVVTNELQDYVPTVTDNSATLDYAGSTLILEADIKVRHYFKLADGQTYSGNLTQYVAPQENPVDGTYYYYESAGITAAELGMMKDYTVDGITVRYCPLSYVTTVLAYENADLGNDKALQNLMKALYLYYKATVAPNNQS